MRPMFSVSGGLLAAALATSLSVQDQTRPGKVEVGSRPSYAFRQPLLNGRGVRSLADLAGRPTLIEFWGTH